MGKPKQIKAELQAMGLKLNYVARRVCIPFDSLIQYLGEHRPMPESKMQLLINEFGLDVKKFGLPVGNVIQKEPA